MKYITVLDFEVGRVFQYENLEHFKDGWNGDEKLDNENIEWYLTTVEGHNLSNCEWMTHEKGHIWAKHNVEQIEASRLYNYNINTNEDG